eukprot:6203539-Pleurochrysis_carterae.AAC.2
MSKRVWGVWEQDGGTRGKAGSGGNGGKGRGRRGRRGREGEGEKERRGARTGCVEERVKVKTV